MRYTWVVIGAVLVVAAVGCSKADQGLPGPTSPTPQLTKAAFVEQANPVCAAADKQITEIASTAPVNNNDATKTQDDLKNIVGQITPIGQTAINQLKNLTPPAEDAATISKGIAQMQSSLDAAQANPTNNLNPIGLVNEELANYGLTSCFTKPE